MNVHPWHLDLWRSLTSDPVRLPHALLLHGPRGIGKMGFAMALGRWLLCSQPTEMGACGHCQSCGWFDQGGHPDFRLVVPAADCSPDGESDKRGGKHITINEIRQIADLVSLVSHQGGWRVVVIHPSELMNAAAANALLKTLEEPPSRVMLILIAHQPRRVLPTVLSRCRKITMKAPQREEAKAWLDAMKMRDACMSLDEAGGAPLLAAELSGIERLERRKRFLHALAEPSTMGLSTIAQEFHPYMEEAWGWLNRWLYDLQVMRITHQPRYFPECATALERLISLVDSAVLYDLQREVAQAGRWLRHSLNPHLLLESWLLGYADMVDPRHGR